MLRQEVPLLLLEAVLFPGAKLPLTVFEERDKRLLEDCLSGDCRVGVALLKRSQGAGKPMDFYEVGTLARIIHAEITSENQVAVVLYGEQRFRVVEIVQYEPYRVGRVEILSNRFSFVSPQLTHLANRLSAMLYRYIELREIADKLALADMVLPTDLMSLGYRIGALLDVPLHEKQELLEVDDINELLLRELEILNREIRQLQQSAFWHQFVRSKARRRTLPIERAIWN
ncbi:MAG: LON peptidase substrate-binding domain-containing protein [Armatimonadetes bacterium]|nr:LON peptidase substrate-binding domain-containing protein [Armatimonadota bacterium]MCX7968494.1 LON peptidase substrate-binding domain-containing protein [Armatimonadota bacterium]MDW8144509.1 LON peptidase substrate-binding domain-containing protein [Armatimonadota bacterium]